jgi:two-component system KDP operon response regulator KdpE
MADLPKVLIIEDDKNLNRLFGKGFTAAGFTVAAAFKLADAITQLRETEFGIIVLDLGLPDGDGWEVADQVRAADLAHKTPVIIMVTGREASEIPAQYVSRYHVLRKPVNLTDLVRLAIDLRLKPGSSGQGQPHS